MAGKEDILNVIKRYARDHKGKPPGARAIREFGITRSMWLRYWPRLTDAQIEAGYPPNRPTLALANDAAIQKWGDLARELGRIPTELDLCWKKNLDPSFPSDGVFRRIGRKRQLVLEVRGFCSRNSDYHDIAQLCDSWLARRDTASDLDGGLPAAQATDGYVYLLKSGRHYKVGQTHSPGRREYEVDLQTPEESKMVHKIRTDDPTGIEAYWHKRFEAKRKRGEWFDWDAADVQAFQRRKFM